MRRLIALVFCGSLFQSGLHGQTHVVRGSVEHADRGPVYLASYYGDSFRVVDSSENAGGLFHFILTGEREPGIYRLIYDEVYEGIRTENRFVEFIYNDEDLEIFVARRNGTPIPDFGESLENRVYKSFMEFEVTYESELMDTYAQMVPERPGDPRYHAAVRAYDSLQYMRKEFVDSLTGRHPGLYATRIIHAFRAPVIPGSMSHRERIDTLKICFFNHAAIGDPSLLRAPVYTFKLLDYLSLYRADTLTRDEQQARYMEAVDHIMVNVGYQEELRLFVVEYLMEGFQRLGMDGVRIHLADNYLDESCVSDLQQLVEARKEGYRNLEPGKRAPGFLIRDIRGQNFRLSEMDDPYVLIVFWSTTCPHCRDLMPELERWYREENGLDLEVVALSLDTSRTDYLDYSEQLEAEWIDARDPLGWLGQVPESYHVYLTPAMYLMDSDRTILAKPSNFRQFLRAIRRLEE